MRAPLPQLEIDFTDTSQEAFDSILPHLGKIEAEVFRVISEAGSRGATSDELEVALAGRHQTISSRIWALGRRGVIRDSGQRRPTRSGRNAAAWVSTVGPALESPVTNGNGPSSPSRGGNACGQGVEP